MADSSRISNLIQSSAKTRPPIKLDPLGKKIPLKIIFHTTPGSAMQVMWGLRISNFRTGIFLDDFEKKGARINKFVLVYFKNVKIS